MSLADVLEGAASALPDHADSIRPANGDPFQLLELLGAEAGRCVLEWVLANGVRSTRNQNCNDAFPIACCAAP